MTVAIGPRKELETSVRFSGTLIPETQSGDALLVVMSDDEVRALEPGDLILWQRYGEAVKAPLAAVLVAKVRAGMVWEKGDEHPFEVPVVEGFLYGKLVRVTIPAPDCLYFVETDVRVPKPQELSDKNFANWASRGGHAVPPIPAGGYEP